MPTGIYGFADAHSLTLFRSLRSKDESLREFVSIYPKPAERRYFELHILNDGAIFLLGLVNADTRDILGRRISDIPEVVSIFSHGWKNANIMVAIPAEKVSLIRYREIPVTPPVHAMDLQVRK